MVRALVCLVAASGILVLPIAAHAADPVTRTVCAGPPACDFTSIQAAIDASLDLDVVSVQPGRYDERVVVDKKVTVRGPGYGFDARVDSSASSNAFTIAGDGTGPSLTITNQGEVSGAVVIGGVGDDIPGVAFATPTIPLPDPTTSLVLSGKLTNSLVVDNTFGVRIDADARAWIGTSRITGNDAAGTGSGVGVRIDGSGSTTYMSEAVVDAQPVAGVRSSNVAPSTLVNVVGTTFSDSPVALDVANAARAALSSNNFELPASGIGIRIGTGALDTEIEQSTFTGGGRAGAVGVEFVGTGARTREVVNVSRFDHVATAIRVASTEAPSSGTSWFGNLFLDEDATAPVLVEVARATGSFANYVACPQAECPAVRGTGAGAAVASDARPAMWFTDHYGKEVHIDHAYANDHAFLFVGLVLPDGTIVDNGYDSARPTYGLEATITGAPSVEQHGPFRVGSSDWFETGLPGERMTFAGTLLGRPFASPSLRLVGESPSPTTRPAISGARTVGSDAVCEPGTWPEEPTSVTYRWERGLYGSGTWLGDGRTHRITRADLRDGGLTCTVDLTFANYDPGYSNAKATVRRVPLVLRLRSLGQRWRVTRCGATLRMACRVTRRAGIRFALDSNSRARTTATIGLQRRVRSRWVPWVKGSIPQPSRSGWVIPSRLARAGTYRLRLTVRAHDIYTGGSSRWVYWRIR
jgi:hypothetical protein